MRGRQHLEAVRLRVREQKELLTGANKELRRLKKTLKTFEVHTTSPWWFQILTSSAALCSHSASKCRKSCAWISLTLFAMCLLLEPEPAGPHGKFVC